jgi:hypothetical protein
VLAALKLKYSPHKTKMGKFNMFHFLGIHFVSTQIEPHKKPQVIVAIHPRSCRRALDKSTAMKEDAIHVAHIQQYLIRWAMWWKRAMMKVLSMEHLLSAWVIKATELKHKLVWLGRGLLHLSFLGNNKLIAQ